jgi:hypothetical protein
MSDFQHGLSKDEVETLLNRTAWDAAREKCWSHHGGTYWKVSVSGTWPAPGIGVRISHQADHVPKFDPLLCPSSIPTPITVILNLL